MKKLIILLFLLLPLTAQAASIDCDRATLVAAISAATLGEVNAVTFDDLKFRTSGPFGDNGAE